MSVNQDFNNTQLYSALKGYKYDISRILTLCKQGSQINQALYWLVKADESALFEKIIALRKDARYSSILKIDLNKVLAIAANHGNKKVINFLIGLSGDEEDINIEFAKTMTESSAASNLLQHANEVITPLIDIGEAFRLEHSLYKAAARDNLKMVTNLIGIGVNVDVALQIAASEKNIDVIKILCINHGASLSLLMHNLMIKSDWPGLSLLLKHFPLQLKFDTELNYDEVILRADLDQVFNIRDLLLREVGYTQDDINSLSEAPLEGEMSKLQQILTRGPTMCESLEAEARRLLYLRNRLDILEKKKIEEMHNIIASTAASGETAMNESLREQVLTNFYNKVKPHFESNFIAFGANSSERIKYIQEAIRKTILKRLSESGNKPIEVFITQNEAALIKMQDSQIASDFRKLLVDNVDVTQVAWRCYDPEAPSVEFDNLFVGRHQDSQIAEIDAYYWLVAVDENVGTSTEREDRISDFISRHAEIRRAHNNGSRYNIDNPSCAPGHITRICAEMQHPLVSFSLKTPIDVIIKNEICALISGSYNRYINSIRISDERKREVCLALTQLSLDTAHNVMQDPFNHYGSEGLTSSLHPYELYTLRKHFHDFMGAKDTLIQQVESRISAQYNKELNMRDRAYVNLLLADLGGTHVGATLTEILLSHIEPSVSSSNSPQMLETPEPVYQNPYTIYDLPTATEKVKRGLKNKTETEILKRAGELVLKQSIKHHLFEYVYHALIKLNCIKALDTEFSSNLVSDIAKNAAEDFSVNTEDLPQLSFPNFLREKLSENGIHLDATDEAIIDHLSSGNAEVLRSESIRIQKNGAESVQTPANSKKPKYT